MAQISLSGISKEFKVHKRPQGKFSVLRGAFRREVQVVKALQDISFSIEQGELVGYIGPNGAGKSTTVKVMSGILTPDRGDCHILGRIPWKERVAHVAHIGVVFGQRSQLWWDVPVADSYDLLRDIYSIPKGQYEARREELVSALSIGDLLQTPVRQLSLGQRMRCELAAALLHSPSILFLDEPTIGLDAVSKLALRAFLKEENRRSGVTMVLTTHDMDDIEALCSRVMVIGRGQLLYDGGLTELKARYAPLHCLRLTFEGAMPDHSALMYIDGVEKAQRNDSTIDVFYDGKAIPTHKMMAAIAGSMPVKDIAMEEQDIDEIIAAMYRDMELE